MISIILTTKNGERLIDRAVRSVLGQTEKDFELIVINDGSTDNTEEIIKNWAHKDARIKIISLEKNIGPGLARERGIREAQGEYIALIDDDDYWISKDKLSLQKKFLNEQTGHILVGAVKTDIMDEDNNLIKYYAEPPTDTDIRNKMLIRNPFVTSSVLFRKDAYQRSGGFGDMYVCEDYDLWLRMGILGKLANIENTDVAYTVRNASASKKRRGELYKTSLALVLKNRTKYPHAFLGIVKCYARIFLFHLQNIA